MVPLTIGLLIVVTAVGLFAWSLSSRDIDRVSIFSSSAREAAIQVIVMRTELALLNEFLRELDER